MSKIKNVVAREVLDSRGFPTVEVEITTKSKIVARAIVPSGASTGVNEALELRDKDPTRFLGKGVLQAVKNVNEIIKPQILGMDVRDQKKIDDFLILLDGTKNKSNLGANAILAVSLAVCKAASIYKKQPLYEYLGGSKAKRLPRPMFNIINGGAHGNFATDIQEFMVIPKSAKTYKEGLRMAVEVYQNLKAVLKEMKLNVNVGDEGGFSPAFKNNEEALSTIIKAIEKANYVPGKDVTLALDVAASEFYNNETKKYYFDKKYISSDELIKYYEYIINKYPLVSIEDGLDQLDWDGWVKLTKKVGDKVQLVGDDLFVTNIEFLKKGIELKAANAILVKMNQIGSVSETIDAINIASKSKYNQVISHRSGESEDTSIAHLAVAFNTGQIKTGAPCRGERTAKYNELLRIEEELGKKAKF